MLNAPVVINGLGTGVSRHHVVQLRALLNILVPSQHYGIEGFKRTSQHYGIEGFKGTSHHCGIEGFKTQPSLQWGPPIEGPTLIEMDFTSIRIEEKMIVLIFFFGDKTRGIPFAS